MFDLSAKYPDSFAFPDSKLFAFIISSRVVLQLVRIGWYCMNFWFFVIFTTLYCFLDRNELQRTQELHEFLSSIEGSPLLSRPTPNSLYDNNDNNIAIKPYYWLRIKDIQCRSQTRSNKNTIALTHSFASCYLPASSSSNNWIKIHRTCSY